jgi:hypothetical protein
VKITDPIHIWHDSEIQAIKWKERFRTMIMCAVIFIPITIAVTFILTDSKFLNKPVQIIERGVFNVPGGRIYVTKDTSKWWLSGDPAYKVTPVEGK